MASITDVRRRVIAPSPSSTAPDLWREGIRYDIQAPLQVILLAGIAKMGAELESMTHRPGSGQEVEEVAGVKPRRSLWMVLLSLPISCGSGDGGTADQDRPVSVPLPRLVHLAPGAEVGQGPPSGWSHRVVRLVPRLVSGDLNALPESASVTATRFRTVITADVVRPTRATPFYRLDRVGVGNALPVGDRELVVTSTQPREAIETIGVVDRVVLITAEAKLKRGVLVARSPTFGLFRTPTVLVIQGKHRDVELYYAMLVNRATGALTTFCWPQPNGDRSPPDSVVRLAPGLSFEARLDARITRRIGPAAVSWSFAMLEPPPGDRVTVPEGVAQVLVEPTRPDRLEQVLRVLATSAGKPAPNAARNTPSRNLREARPPGSLNGPVRGGADGSDPEQSG